MALAARRYVGYVTVLVVAGVGAGILVAGAGGRLVMRLLAVTADDAAQGRETEAEEIVGQISAGGTVDFIVFTALFFGLIAGAAYLLIRRWLPGGRLGGLAFGVLLLVVAATRIEPLRGDNKDFDIVGPGWVAATAFGLLVVLHGMLVAAVAARYSRALPLVAANRRCLLAHAPLLVLIPAFPALIVTAIGGVAAVGLSRLKPVVEILRSHKTLVARSHGAGGYQPGGAPWMCDHGRGHRRTRPVGACATLPEKLPFETIGALSIELNAHAVCRSFSGTRNKPRDVTGR